MWNEKNSDIRNLVILILWSSVLFGLNIWGYDLWSPDEPRYAEVAREMLVLNNYFVPHVNGYPYLEKPPLLMWLMIVFSLPFGEITEIPARLPSVLSGVITVVLVYLLAKQLFNIEIAWLSAAVFMTIQRVWWQARFGQIDMLLTALLFSFFYIFYVWQKEEKRRPYMLILMYLCILCGLFAKGPGTLAFPVLFLIVYYWREKKKIFEIYPITGFLTVILIYSIWYFYARWTAADSLQHEVSSVVWADLFKQTIGRFIYGVSHPQPPWYYFISIPEDMFPWTIFILWVIPWVWKNRSNNESIRWLLSWIVPPFIFFSIAVGKRAIYLLPIFPALAILTAVSLHAFEETATLRWKNLMRVFWIVILIVLAILPIILLWTKYSMIWNAYWLILSLFGLVALGDTVWGFFKSPAGRSLLTQIPQHTSIYMILIVLIVFPSVNTLKSVRSFCEPLRDLSERKVQYEAYSFAFEEEEYTYYARHFIVPFFTARELNEFAVYNSKPYEMLNLISDVHDKYTRAMRKIPVNNILELEEGERKKIEEAIEKIRRESEELKIIDKYQQVEGYFFSKVDQLTDILSKNTPVFLLIREEDWKWVLWKKPELGKLVTQYQVRDMFRRPLYLFGNPATKNIMEK